MGAAAAPVYHRLTTYHTRHLSCHVLRSSASPMARTRALRGGCGMARYLYAYPFTLLLFHLSPPSGRGGTQRPAAASLVAEEDLPPS